MEYMIWGGHMDCSWAVVDKANVAGETWAGLLLACP